MSFDTCNRAVTAPLGTPPFSSRVSLRLPVALEFIPVHVCTSKVVRKMASRRGLEPLTPGLGSAISVVNIGSPTFKSLRKVSLKCAKPGSETILNNCELPQTILNGSEAAKL